MPGDTEIRQGTCPEHGLVQATRYMPKIGFPFFVFFIMRARAKRKPFECPICSKSVRLT